MNGKFAVLSEDGVVQCVTEAIREASDAAAILAQQHPGKRFDVTAHRGSVRATDTGVVYVSSNVTDGDPGKVTFVPIEDTGDYKGADRD